MKFDNCSNIFLGGSLIIIILLLIYLYQNPQYKPDEIGGLIIGAFILFGYANSCEYYQKI
jgi:hypothetical protein